MLIKTRSCRLVLTCLLGVPWSVSALTDAEIEERFKAYEQRIQQLEQQLNKNDELDEERMSLLNQQVDYIAENIPETNTKLSIKGFMTAGVATTDQEGGDYFTISNDDIDSRADSKIGLHMLFNVNDSTEVQAQLLAKGSENFDLDMKWAFIQHEISDALSLRAGRLQTPLFSFSDHINVGYAYPWVRPPAEVYGLVRAQNLDAINMIYTFSINDSVHAVSAYYGRIFSDDGGNAAFDEVDVSDAMGGRITSHFGHWTMGVGYTQGKANVVLSSGLALLNRELVDQGFGELVPDDTETDFLGVGFSYVGETWLLIGEHGRRRAKGLYSELEGNYLTIARTVGEFQPYISYARGYTKDDAQRQAIADAVPTTLSVLARMNDAQRSMTYGVRYDFMPRIALKAEYQHIYDMENGGFWTEAPGKTVEGNADIVSFTVDTVF